MRRIETLDPIERFAPGGFGLGGESGDEIDVVVGDAGVSERADILGDGLRGMLAAGAADFGIDERLRA